MRERNQALQRRPVVRPQLNGSAKTAGLNKPLFSLSVGLYIFGAFMIYSASAVLAKERSLSSFHFLGLQLMWLFVAFILGYLSYKFDLKLLARADVSTAVLLTSVLGLILVLFIGKNLNGATRWIDLGPFDLQPSEIAKLAYIIYLSALLANRGKANVSANHKYNQDQLKIHIQTVLLPFITTLGLVCGLILLQPDLDTSVIIALTALSVYYVSGTDFLHTVGTIAVFVVGAMLGVVAGIMAPYRLDRIKTWWDFIITGDVTDKFGTGNQIWHSLIAISSGGLLGIGYGEARSKLYYLNEAAYTDSIFSVVAEEFGLLGTCVVIFCFIYFLYLGINIARNAPDRFNSLLAIGITTWITIQAFFNIGANLTIVPLGGIPLPFISYGGSNTLMIAVGVGLLLNIHSRSSVKRS